MLMPKTMLEWLEEHAELREGRYVCKKTGIGIESGMVGRSLWVRPFAGGWGDVAKVLHVVCLACDPEAKPPAHGEPIYEDELVEVEMGVRACT